MSEFMIGVNYWASHAGTDMWRNWNESSVRADLAALRENGVEVLRVFPIWRDFQPVTAAWGCSHTFKEYRMVDDSWPQNPFFLDEVMVERFKKLCSIASENGQKLIVGLITGWMSGRLFVPPVLENRNLYTDPEALWIQQLFVQGFVRAVKNQPAVWAWDLGNECNCLENAASRQEACHWTATIVNAIRAEDPSRKIVSGMHSLDPGGKWTPADQGFWTDILTTHPYPYWMDHGRLAPLDEYRTLLQATAQTEYYAGLGGKPCLVEEIGTMGPMICDDEIGANFLWTNLWSNWANGATGLLWWCAFDQNQLNAPPYDWNMCERELGLLRRDRTPKQTAAVLKKFSEIQNKLNLQLPEKIVDAACILTAGQDPWGVAYTSYLLAKQAGFTLEFAWQEQELPKREVYLLPSVRGEVMSKRRYDTLKKYVSDGATLYISMDGGILTEFEELTGFRVRRWAERPVFRKVLLGGQELSYEKDCDLELISTEAEILLRDTEGRPLLGCHSYGKGKVYLLNLPLEKMLLNKTEGYSQPWYLLYQTFFGPGRGPIWKKNPEVGMTLHPGKNRIYAVLTNYSGSPAKPEIEFDGCRISGYETLLGDPGQIEPYGTAIVCARCS